MSFFDSQISLTIKWVLIWFSVFAIIGFGFGQWLNNKIRD